MNLPDIASDYYPLSKKKSIKGNRRLAREKALQILTAYEISRTPWEQLFKHIFYREFNFDDDGEKPKKLLTPDEIIEIEADIPIHWEADDVLYVRALVKYSIEKIELFNDLIKDFAEHWELDRIAIIDKIIMQQTTAELLYFPEIPTKVSINEAIDLAKKYSTDKSGVFINGILDAILEKLENEKKINKTGRGLIDK